MSCERRMGREAVPCPIFFAVPRDQTPGVPDYKGGSAFREKGRIVLEDRDIIALYWERSEEAILRTAAMYGAYCAGL